MLTPRARLRINEALLWFAAGMTVWIPLLVPEVGYWTIAFLAIACGLCVAADRTGRRADKTFGWPVDPETEKRFRQLGEEQAKRMNLRDDYGGYY